MLLKAVTARYKEHAKWAHQMLYDYYTVCKIARKNVVVYKFGFSGEMVDDATEEFNGETDFTGDYSGKVVGRKEILHI